MASVKKQSFKSLKVGDLFSFTNPNRLTGLHPIYQKIEKITYVGRWDKIKFNAISDYGQAAYFTAKRMIYKITRG